MSFFPIFWDIETTGLNPMIEPWSNWGKASQVTAVGLGVIENYHDNPSPEEAELNIKALYDEDEYRLLSLVPDRAEEMVGDGEPIIVGYNSRQYDHPYSGARWARKRLSGEPINTEWRRLDMMRVAKVDPRIPKSYPKEGEYADALDVNVPDPYDGSDMPEAFENREWKAIETHVRADVRESMLMFLERKDLMMDTFYDHYDIDAQGGPVEEIDLE